MAETVEPASLSAPMPSSIMQSELESFIRSLDLFFEKLQVANHDGDTSLLEQYFALCNIDPV